MLCKLESLVRHPFLFIHFMLIMNAFAQEGITKLFECLTNLHSQSLFIDSHMVGDALYYTIPSFGVLEVKVQHYLATRTQCIVDFCEITCSYTECAANSFAFTSYWG